MGKLSFDPPLTDDLARSIAAELSPFELLALDLADRSQQVRSTRTLDVEPPRPDVGDNTGECMAMGFDAGSQVGWEVRVQHHGLISLSTAQLADALAERFGIAFEKQAQHAIGELGGTQLAWNHPDAKGRTVAAGSSKVRKVHLIFLVLSSVFHMAPSHQLTVRSSPVSNFLVRRLNLTKMSRKPTVLSDFSIQDERLMRAPKTLL